MSKDDDYIYSYIDKKMIKANDKHKFDNERYKNKKRNKLSVIGAITLGIASGILVLSFIIFKDIGSESGNIESTNVLKSVLPKSNTKVENMNNFLNTSSSIVTETNNILKNMINTYSNKDFSESTKNNLENSLVKLNDYDLNQFDGDEYTALKNNLGEHVNIIKTCIEYYSVLNNQSNEASNYLNKLIEQKRDLGDSFIENVKDALNKAGFKYKILDDGRIKFN